jgi:ketosteroid isomerase-like protein
MKVRLIAAQQIGAWAAKFNEAFDRNDAAGVAAFCTEDAVRVTPHGTRPNPKVTLTNPIALTSPVAG